MRTVDILLSTHNGSSFLQDQLNSIIKQSNTTWHLIARDDGSIDKTLAILNEVGENFPDLVEITQNMTGCLGPAGSFSLLLSCAQAPYMMLCDQDDVWLPDKIEKTLSAMRAAEERFGVNTPLLVHTDLCVVDSNLEQLSQSFLKYQNLNPKLAKSLNRLMPQNFVTGCTVMINQSLARLATPIPKDAIMHDWWLALVAVAFGQIVYLNEPTVLYRQHGANSIGAKLWDLKRIVALAQNTTEARLTMLRKMRQAQALLDRYQDKMSPERIATVEAYAHLQYMSKAVRVMTILKHRFFMDGVIRNIGLMINMFMLDSHDVKLAQSRANNPKKIDVTMKVNRLLRVLVPSTVRLSYNSLFKMLNPIADIPILFNSSYRHLPPNHLRVRIGVGNKLLFNHLYYLQAGQFFYDQFAQRGFVNHNSAILEIGSGAGRMAIPFARSGFCGSYTGIDIDVEMVNWCRNNFDSRFKFLLTTHNSKTYEGSSVSRYYRLPIETNSIDFIFSTSLFTHLLEFEMRNYITECERVAKPGAFIVMSYFCRDTVAIGGRWTFKHRIGKAYVENLKYPEAAVAYDQRYLEGLFRSSGFKSVTTEASEGQSLLVAQR